MAGLTGQPTLELLAESETKFFFKAIEAEIEFVKDSTGRVTQMDFRQGGLVLEAKKIK
jgi:hypothetical protein